MNKKDLILLRPAELDRKNYTDSDFIEATWKAALYHGNPLFNLIDEPSFYRNYKLVIQGLLNNPDLTIQMACLKEDPSLCLAYSVSDQDTLHFVYTKRDWRKIGLMNDLAPQEITRLTHLTETGKSIWKKKWPRAIFNPFLLEKGDFNHGR